MGCADGVRVEAVRVSWGGIDLGLLDGDIDYKSEEQSVDITAHQTGSTVLDSFRTGRKMELALTLKETSAAQINTMIEAAGQVAVAVAEVTSVTCVADIANSLSAKYFYIYSALNAVKYYVWIDTGASVDPAPAGATGLHAVTTTGASASVVATAVALVVNAHADFNATSLGGVVTITNAAVGGASDAVDVNSTFIIAVVTQGIGAVSGWGSAKDFTSQYADSDILVLHPVALAAADQSRDLCVWKAYPMLSSILYSGENPMTVAVTFKAFPDCSRPATSDFYVYGAHQ